MTRQGLIFTGPGVIALAAYPWVFRSNYAINVGFLILFAAYLGQTWNIAGGFAGQTSFGHVVFFGVGAYVSTILQTTYGVNAWIAWPFSALAGAFTAFRQTAFLWCHGGGQGACSRLLRGFVPGRPTA